MFRPTARVVLVVAALLMVPLLAMRFTDQVVWGPLDFAVAGTLLLGTGLAYQFGVRRAGNLAYRLAMGMALGSALFVVWANLAVGAIGDEGNPANLMYIGVLAVGIAGAVAARLQPRGMARAMFATALAVVVVAVVALALGLGATMEIVGVNALFAALFCASALLFQSAARK